MQTPVPFDLSHCRRLSIERPAVEVREDDVTEAFRTLAEATTQLQDKRDFQALAHHLGFNDALAVRREVRAQLERQRDDAVRHILRLRVLGSLVRDFPYEPTEEEVRLEVVVLVRDAEEIGQQLSDKRVRDVIEPLARKRVISSALVRELAQQLSALPNEEETLAALEHHAELYRDPEAVLTHLRQNSAAAKPVVDELIEDRVVAAVLELAQVTEQTLSLRDLASEFEQTALAFSGNR